MCNTQVKSELLWNAHLQGRTHKEVCASIFALKNEQKLTVVSLCLVHQYLLLQNVAALKAKSEEKNTPTVQPPSALKRKAEHEFHNSSKQPKRKCSQIDPRPRESFWCFSVLVFSKDVWIYSSNVLRFVVEKAAKKKGWVAFFFEWRKHPNFFSWSSTCNKTWWKTANHSFHPYQIARGFLWRWNGTEAFERNFEETSIGRWLRVVLGGGRGRQVRRPSSTSVGWQHKHWHRLRVTPSW